MYAKKNSQLLNRIIEEKIAIHVSNKFEAYMLSNILEVNKPDSDALDCKNLLFNDYLVVGNWRDSELELSQLAMANNTDGYTIIKFQDFIKCYA
jgi:hypothetical protein